MLSTAITGTNDPMAKKPGSAEAPKDKTEDETAPVLMKREEGKPDPKGTDSTAPVEVQSGPDDETPPPVSAERADTGSMPTNLGRPPEMPTSSAPPPLALGDVEAPTHMPGPRDIPGGEPADRAPAPGRVPPGDSRSLRRADEFALIYRVGTYVVSRYGAMGTRGQWRVVEYPTSSSASHSYAKECSRFVSEGFSDYRG